MRRRGLFGSSNEPGDAYDRAYQREWDIHRPRTEEELRSGVGPLGRDIPVPGWMLPAALGVQNFETGLSDWNAQIYRNLGIADELQGASGYVGQLADNITRGLSGQPVGTPASVAARAASDYSLARQAQYHARHPMLDAAATLASIPATAGTEAGAAARLTPLNAGLAAMGVNAPFALARQEGDLPRRLPGAMREEAATGLLGASLQSISNSLTPLNVPRTLQTFADRFVPQVVPRPATRVNVTANENRPSAPGGRRHPNVLEYLHAPPGTYPTIDNPPPPPPVDRLADRWSQGPAPQFLLSPPPADANDTEGWLETRPIGPGGVTDRQPWQGRRAPRVSLASALAPPLAAPDTPQAPAPFGLLPGMNGSVRNDAGVGVADASPELEGLPRLRTPRTIYRPGMPMPANAAANELDGPEGWLFRLAFGSR